MHESVWKVIFVINAFHAGGCSGSEGYLGSFLSKAFDVVGYKPCWKGSVFRDKPEFHALIGTHLFGQHIAADVVRKAVNTHFNDENPRKALTLSFHGWTGCGKNHLANLLVRGLYNDGTNSPFVHHFVGSVDTQKYFNQHSQAEDIQQDIKARLEKCKYSTFIFDEVEFMHPNALDALKPFLEYHSHNYAKLSRFAIFIFLANTGASGIARITLDQFRNGLPRESLSLKSFEKVVSSSSFNEEGGYLGSRLISSGLIDHFVPFMPLEKKHVLLCVEEYLSKLGKTMKQTEIDAVVDSLSFKPDDTPIYSETGCKRVQQKLILQLHDEL